MRLRRSVAAAIACTAIALFAVACADDDSPTSLPTAVMSASEISLWGDDALAFAERFNEGHPDGEAVFAEFTNDGIIMDPSNNDVIEGDLPSVWNEFAKLFPDLDAHATAAYLSADSTAVFTDVDHLAEFDPLHEIRLFRFENGLATTLEFWYSAEDLERMPHGCFVPGGCASELRDLADRYMRAWSAGNKDDIAALYSDDAVFADSLLGIDASGPGQISGLHDERFGSGREVTCTIVDLYAQTIGEGPLYGLGIHYRCAIAAGDDSKTVDSVALIQLGTRKNSSYVRDPGGLIVGEEVFHTAASLVATGIAP